MRIAEIFYSIQGEGKLVGVPSVFVRVSGCNLRCVWCDTPYASWAPEGEDTSIEEIVREVEKHPAEHVVVTGGEPMMFKEIVALIRALKARGTHITVETAGTLWQEGLSAGEIDLLSVSPKLANSTPWEREGGRFATLHEAKRIDVEVLRQLARGEGGVIVDRQWKFVLTSAAELGEMERLVGLVNEGLTAGEKIRPGDIMLMPEGVDGETLMRRGRELAEICKERGYRLSPRLHVVLFGNTRGT